MSALSFWPVHGWSPGLFNTLLASVQATSMLALGPKETCSLLYLLVCITYYAKLWSEGAGDFISINIYILRCLYQSSIFFLGCYLNCVVRFLCCMYDQFFCSNCFSLARVIYFLRKIYGFGLLECLC